MSTPPPPSSPTRFEAALRLIDAENARDPNQVEWQGRLQPRELCYSRWLSRWVDHLCPEASEELRIAAYCQHICRWEIPRDSYPMTRPGYLRWREDLKEFHAMKAAEILRKVGYPEQFVARVQELNLKRKLGHDPETQILEDALCLVFLEHQLGDLAEKTTDEQVINALQKSWRKMSPAAREIASSLPYRAREKALLDKALSAPAA